MIGNGDLASIGGVGGISGGEGRHDSGSKRREMRAANATGGARVGGLKEEEAEPSETHLSLAVFTAASWDTVGKTSGLTMGASTMGASSAKGTAENDAAQAVS